MFEKVLNTPLSTKPLKTEKINKPHMAKANLMMAALRQATSVYLITGKPLKQALQLNQITYRQS